jgi:hypothetical protein
MSTPKWLNTGTPDGGAISALLELVARRVPANIVDEVWVFPSRPVTGGESTVVVLAAFDDDALKRRVITARFIVSRNNRGVAAVREITSEHGSAPTDALPRVIEGVLRRLGDDAAVPPHGEAIGGSAERWDALVARLAEPDSVGDRPPRQLPGAGRSAINNHS